MENKSVLNSIRFLNEQGIQRCPTPSWEGPHKCPTPVTINVYHLVQRNDQFRKVGFGIFHVGVVIFGTEWSYGESIEGGHSTGLFHSSPGLAGDVFKSIGIGQTTLSASQVDTILHRLENEWRSKDYHILHHNCIHFSQRFCDLLSTTMTLRVPSWCNRAARVSDKVIPRSMATKIQRKITGKVQPPKAVPALTSYERMVRKHGRLTSVDDGSSLFFSQHVCSISGANPSEKGGTVKRLPKSVIPPGWYNNSRVYYRPEYSRVVDSGEHKILEWNSTVDCYQELTPGIDENTEVDSKTNKRSSKLVVLSSLPGEVWRSEREGGFVLHHKKSNVYSVDDHVVRNSVEGVAATPLASKRRSLLFIPPQENEAHQSVVSRRRRRKCPRKVSPSLDNMPSLSPAVESEGTVLSMTPSLSSLSLSPFRHSFGKATSSSVENCKLPFCAASLKSLESISSSSRTSPVLHPELNSFTLPQENDFQTEASRSSAHFSGASRGQTSYLSSLPSAACASSKFVTLKTSATLFSPSKKEKKVEEISLVNCSDGLTSTAAPPPLKKKSINKLESLGSNPFNLDFHTPRNSFSNSSNSITSVANETSVEKTEALSASPEVSKVRQNERENILSKTWYLPGDIRAEKYSALYWRMGSESADFDERKKEPNPFARRFSEPVLKNDWYLSPQKSEVRCAASKKSVGESE